MKNCIWIAWEQHRRNQSICHRTNIPLVEIEISCAKLARYPILLAKTLVAVSHHRPKVLVVQNPSIFLASFAIVWGKLHRRCAIVDAHNVGIYFEHDNFFIKKIGQWLNHLIMKNAAMVIVTNIELAKYVNQKGGNAFILPDPFPYFERYDLLKLRGKRNILYICTFSKDEPYKEMFEAAERLSEDIVIYVTGKHHSGQLPQQLPQNLILTGFLPEQEYINILFSVDLVVDLTIRENCLLCGAYEAIGAGKPQVLTNKRILREYFGNAAIYTDNSPEDISQKINIALMEPEKFLENIRTIKKHRENEWERKKNSFQKIINECS